MRETARSSSARPGRATRVLACAGLLILLSAAPSPARPDTQGEPGSERRRDDAVTFTLSGGVSLGVYEAGLAWGAVRLLQAVRELDRSPILFRPRLATVTGASAGAVNAFLAAALWCERPERRGGVERNLLLDAWLDLDLSELLPRSTEGYTAGDGLLAAAPLELTGRLVGEALFGRAARGRFLPGCQVPVGLTVTPIEPRLRDVAGLTASTQRLVLSWRLEAEAGGELIVRRQPLPRSDLSDDLLDLAGIPGPGEAASFRPEVAVSALLASTAFPVAFAPRRLCERRDEHHPGQCELYVDGGIFDNVPLGLGLGLVEGTGSGTVLHPITSFLADPDRRRLQPLPAEPGVDAAPTTLAQQLRLFGNLLGTARSAELSRAARARGWNRTTERIAREAAAVAGEVADLFADEPGAEVPASESEGSTRAPAGQVDGRAVAVCLERLARPAASGEVTACAVERGVVAAAPLEAEPLSAEELVRLSELLVRFVQGAGERDRLQPGATIAARQRSLHESTSIAKIALSVLADGARRVSASRLPDRELRRFRDAVLEPVRRSGSVEEVMRQILRDRLDQELAWLAEGSPPDLADEARRARARLERSPEGAPVDLDALEARMAERSGALGRGWPDTAAVEGAWRRVLRVLSTLARVSELSSRLEGLRQDVANLADGSRPEHQLVLSTRFAPLAGSGLAGFAAFLDRPLRQYDFEAGVYEAIHAIAAGICANEPLISGDAIPVWLQRDPSELDLRAPGTQRCIGQIMREAVWVLGLRASPQSGRVVATLAGLELAAWLGSSSQANALRGEPSWSWLDEIDAPAPGDPVLAVLDALTEAKVPCGPGDEERLCPGELGFEDFLVALRARGYRPQSAEMALAMNDPALWRADVVQRLADRALAVEHASDRATRTPLITPVPALAATSLWARRVASRGSPPSLLLDPSTIPGAATGNAPRWGLRRLAAHAVPYRLELDVSRGGFAAAWLEPELHLARWLALQSTLEEVGYRPGTGWTSAAGALVIGRAVGLSLGIGPRWWLDWSGGSGFGAEARLSGLQDRLAIGVATREGISVRADGWFITVSVADLNGLLFWLLPPGPRP